MNEELIEKAAEKLALIRGMVATEPKPRILQAAHNLEIRKHLEAQEAIYQAQDELSKDDVMVVDDPRTAEESELKKKPLTLDEHNRQISELMAEDSNMRAAGILCNKCGVRMLYSNDVILSSIPPRRNVHCPACGETGYKIV